MRPRYECPIDGCPDVRCVRESAEEHKKRPHVRCMCGWAGVKFTAHKAAMAGRSDAVTHLQVPFYESFA